MRLCDPYFRALGRTLAAASFLSGVMAAFGLVALGGLARLCDASLGFGAPPDRLPLIIVVVVAISGAVVVHLARTTMVNRRKSWLDYGLGETVLTHELWLGSERRERDRSLAAVITTGRFIGSSAGLAVTEAPWALAALGGLWVFDARVALVANGLALGLLLVALWGSRLTSRAVQFDTTRHGVKSGEDAIKAAGLGRDASHDHAQIVAARWEETQRTMVAAQYKEAQARVRRHLVSKLMVAAASCAVATIEFPALMQHAESAGDAVMILAAAGFGQVFLLRWIAEAPLVASTRAALRHLAPLRAASGRGGARLPLVVQPDLRAPAALAAFATMAAVAALVAVSVYWQLPLFDHAPARPVAALTLGAAHSGIRTASQVATQAAVGADTQRRR